MPKKLIVVTLLSIFVFFSGCSYRPPGMPVLYPCKITVTQEGVPLADASVMLINISSTDVGNAWAPMGKTNSNGVAVMQTNAQYSGAAAGKYRIIVDKSEFDPSKVGPHPPIDSPEFAAWERKRDSEVLAEYYLVEAVYSSPQTPHEIDVSKGSNEMTIDVGKAVRIKKR